MPIRVDGQTQMYTYSDTLSYTHTFPAYLCKKMGCSISGVYVDLETP